MSIAVLDFQNLSRDTGDAWLGQGIAGELTSRLGQVGRLTVASRTAVQRLRDPAAMRLADVGRSLNAAYLVNGTVQRAGPRLRVTAELVRVANGAQVWSEQFDRTETDLLAIQEAVSRAVATAVTGRLLPSERTILESRPTRSPEAYAAFVRGSALSQSGEVWSDQRAALASFEHAVALDSSFAEAWAGLSRVSARIYWNYIDRSDARLVGARTAAEHARALAPESPMTHVAWGYYYYFAQRDFGRALSEFAAVLAREPNNVEVHHALANVARRQGDFARSLASRTRALELDPENQAALTERALTYTWMRRFDDAERDYARVLAMNPQLSSDPYGMMAFLLHDGSPHRAPDRAAAIASNVAAVSARLFEDPEALLPLLRLSADVQSAMLLIAPPEEPRARAAYWLSVATVLATGQRGREAAVAYDSARAGTLRLLDERPNDDRFHAMMSVVWAGLGDCTHAIEEAERGRDLMPIETDAMTGAVNQLILAQIEARCGRLDQATVRLEFLLSRPAPITIALLRTDPVWIPLHGTMRYERLIATGP